jgi:hypothetical protein
MNIDKKNQFCGFGGFLGELGIPVGFFCGSLGGISSGFFGGSGVVIFISP